MPCIQKKASIDNENFIFEDTCVGDKFIVHFFYVMLMIGDSVISCPDPDLFHPIIGAFYEVRVRCGNGA